MGKRDRFEPGTFSWVELATTDPDSAKAFYRSLFGWEAEDAPIPEEAGGGTYTMMLKDGQQVAGLAEQSRAQRDAGLPASWFSYVTVTNADSSAAKATEAGGSVHAGPFDVMDTGRMAVICDPTGAMFGVWQAGTSIGATLVNDPGALTSNELATNDVETASSFYEKLFGWRIVEQDTQGGPPYWLIEHDGAAGGQNGGIRELADQKAVPPHWMPYFTVTDLDKTVARAREEGGIVHADPIEIPSGRIAVITDPQGAFLGLFEGEVDD